MSGADLSLALAMLAAKSAVIAALGLAAARWLGRSPAERVLLLRAAVALIVALPFLAALAPDFALAVLPAPEPITPVAYEFGPMWTGQVAAVGDVAVAAALPWPTLGGLLATAWIVGLCALAARLFLGLHTLSRWTEQGEVVAQPHWRDWLARLSGPQATPRLVSSPRISGPLSWGARRGVILIDPASLAARDAAPAILAHELAHLQRRDWIFLVLSRLALAAFWFNPLVWRLHAALTEASEEAADAQAAQAVGRDAYARTLVRLAAHPSPFAATAMAADARSLKKRIALLMTESVPARRRPGRPCSPCRPCRRNGRSLYGRRAPGRPDLHALCLRPVGRPDLCRRSARLAPAPSHIDGDLSTPRGHAGPPAATGAPRPACAALGPNVPGRLRAAPSSPSAGPARPSGASCRPAPARFLRPGRLLSVMGRTDPRRAPRGRTGPRTGRRGPTRRGGSPSSRRRGSPRGGRGSASRRTRRC